MSSPAIRGPNDASSCAHCAVELLSTRGRTGRSRGSNQPPNSPRCWRPRQRRAERAKMGKPSGKAKGAKPPVLLVCTHACAQRTRMLDKP